MAQNCRYSPSCGVIRPTECLCYPSGCSLPRGIQSFSNQLIWTDITHVALMYSSDLRAKVKRAVARGESRRSVADTFEIDRETVSRIVNEPPGPSSRRPRPPSATAKARRKLLDHAVKLKRNKDCMRYASLRALKTYLGTKGHRVDRTTIRRDLLAMGYDNRVKDRVPSTEPTVLNKRVTFARSFLRNVKPTEVVFSDESYFTCDNHTCRTQWVKKRHAGSSKPLPKRLQQKTLKRQKAQRGSVPFMMVWGAVGYNYKSPLVLWRRQKFKTEEGKSYWKIPRMNSRSYIKQVLSKVVPGLQSRPNTVFQQDGASSHSAKDTQKYLDGKGIKTCDWSSHSPDMNMIEHVWGAMKQLVAERMPRTDQELAEAVQAVWDEYPQEKINHMVERWHHKLRRVVNTSGEYR